MKNILDKIRIDNTMYILILLGLLSGYLKNIFIIVLIILVHELGHVFFFSLFNIDIQSVVIYPFGGLCTVNKKIHERIYKDVLISLGGVLFQGILLFVVFLLYKGGFILNSTYDMFISYNIRIILFNMIPLIPLDGSKLLFSILSKYLAYRISYIIVSVCGFISLVSFIIYNVYFKLNDIVIYWFLLVNLICFIRDYKNVMGKFYVERIIYDNYYDGIISDSLDIRKMRIDKYYYYKVGDKYVNERKYILNNR